MHRERPDDGDPLLLAPGQPVRELLALVGEPEPLEQRGRVLLRVRSRDRCVTLRGASVTLSRTVMWGNRL